jgi:antitoxin VapB
MVSIIDIYHLELNMTATAKLFMHGRSQAVRLPKEFRMPGTEVNVRREGDKIVLEPVAKKAKSPEDWKALWSKLHAMGSDDFMINGREQPPLPEERDFGFDS